MSDRYRIFETGSFRREFKKALSPAQQELVAARLTSRIYPALRKEPHYGAQIKKLKGYAFEAWRYRIGDLRLFYSIDEGKKVVVLTAIRLRKDAYR